MISAAIVIERMDYPALAVNDESEGEGAVVGRGIGSNEESETYSAGGLKGPLCTTCAVRVSHAFSEHSRRTVSPTLCRRRG